tara:strand:+ start:53 stop:364 length:312 start_codon:yes stop_codon:yes gene_type:complete
MRYLKTPILLALTLFLFSCGGLKEGFVNQKKTSSDEFLVEKKSPLVMPPDYSELPFPKKEANEEVSETNKIKELVSNDNNENNKTNNPNLSFEELLLEKIRKN